MIKIFSILFCLIAFLEANEFYAKINPLEVYNIKADISGKVLYVNDALKGSVAKNATILELDNKVDLIELTQVKLKLTHLKQIIKIEKSTLDKFLKIKSKSQLDKDKQNIKVLNLLNQQSDLNIRIAQLEDKISKKSFEVSNLYISDIYVKKNEFVNINTLIYKAYDLTKGKLEIFIPIKDIKKILNKTIFIDSKKTNYKIHKLYKIASTKHISSYKCEILVDKPKLFSSLVKIEFR
jgi:hypothetical protein